MATASEVIAILIKADGAAAVRELDKVGASAKRNIGGAGKETQSFTEKVKSNAGTIAAWGGTIAGVGAVAYDLALKASELEQSVGAVDTVFGRSAGTIEKFGDTSAEAFGISERAANQLTAQLGAMLTNLGYTQQEAAASSVELAKLGADLSAAFGGKPEEAVLALSSALRGERDPIERYGVSLKEADVQQRLAQKGMKNLSGEAKKHATAVATLELIYEQTSKVQGQFARESDTAAGTMAVFTASMEDLQAELGTELLPALRDLASVGTDLLNVYGQLPSKEDGGLLGGVGEALFGIGNGVKSVKDLSNALFGAGDAASDLAGKTDDLDRAEGRRQAQARRSATETEDEAAALDEAADATERFRDQQNKLFDEVTGRREKILGQRDAYRDLVGSQIALAQAQDDVTLAQENYDQAVEEHGKNSREARDAQRDLELAVIGVGAASDDSKQAVLDYAAAFGGTEADAGPRAIQKTIDALEKVRDTLAPDSPLRSFLDSYIKDLKESIPAHIHTDLTITVGGEPVTLRGTEGGKRGPGRAIGGPVSADGIYPVGEHGPELFRPSVPGVIIPNHQLRSGDGQGYTSVTVHIHGDVNSEIDFERKVTAAVANATRRGTL